MRRRGKSSRNKAQSLAEVALGCLLMVPFALFLLDISALVLGCIANQELAQRAARAAANRPTPAAAEAALRQIRETFTGGRIIRRIESLRIIEFDIQGNQGIRVRSELTIALPVPVPLIPNNGQELRFVAEASQPIVALAAVLE